MGRKIIIIIKKRKEKKQWYRLSVRQVVFIKVKLYQKENLRNKKETTFSIKKSNTHVSISELADRRHILQERKVIYKPRTQRSSQRYIYILLETSIAEPVYEAGIET